MSKKKILIGLVVVLAIGGYVAKSMFLKPKVIPPKIAGEVYVLPKTFTMNLADGRYATLTVALELAPGQSDGASAAAAGGSTDTGIGTLPEEAVIRSIITRTVTGVNGDVLTSASGSAELEQQILQEIKSQTDVKVDQIYFTDMAVQ
jgi:flagellar basal body-associated protein FliL